MPSHLVSSLLRYGCAFFSVALAIGCRLLLDPVLGVQSDGEHLVNFVHLPFALVLLAVLVNAYYGGFRPALTAALLGAVALDFFFLAPRWSFYLAGLDQQVGMVLFLLTGLGIAVLGGAMHSAQRSLIVANESLETRISERTKELTEANEKLRLSEERNRLQVEGISSYGIFMLDPAGNVTTWNTGAVRIMGYNAEEIIGHHLSRLYTPEDVAGGTPQRDLQLAVEKGSREDERSCVRKDGSQFWSAVTITAMFDPSRRPIGFVTVTRDISRQKELAIALEDAARFNRATLDGLAAHIAIIDEDGVIAATNEPWEKFGVADGLTVGRGSVGDNYLNVCDRSSGPHAQVSPDVAASIRAVLACEVPQFALEYPCHSPTEQRWFIVRVTPFPGTERRRVIIAHENITERKAAEEALQAEHDRFEKIVSAVPVVICSYRERPDGTACFPFANAAIEQIYGFRPEELEQDATPIFARMHAEDAGRIRTTLDESARTMSPWRGEFRVNNPTRGEIWVEGHVIPVAEPNGDTLWQGYIADITERKRTEAALRESEQRLRLFFEHTPIALAMFDDQMRYVAVSNRWKSDFGFSPDESMIGLSHYEVFPDLLDHWKRAHARIGGRGRPRRRRSLRGSERSRTLVQMGGAAVVAKFRCNRRDRRCRRRCQRAQTLRGGATETGRTHRTQSGFHRRGRSSGPAHVFECQRTKDDRRGRCG
jgi:PAS domain S-box-containing protein